MSTRLERLHQVVVNEGATVSDVILLAAMMTSQPAPAPAPVVAEWLPLATFAERRGLTEHQLRGHRRQPQFAGAFRVVCRRVWLHPAEFDRAISAPAKTAPQMLPARPRGPKSKTAPGLPGQRRKA